MQFICDWSHWQGDLNPEVVAREGFAAVKLKVGGAIKEGWSYLDPKFLGNAARLRAQPERSWTGTPPAPLGRIAYWYLMPGNPVAQFGLLIDTLEKVGGYENWHVQLDVEQDGLAFNDIAAWTVAWNTYTDNTPFSIYTRRSFWLPRIDANASVMKGLAGGWSTPLLEEAHWVPQAVRVDPAKPYASQQVHSVKDAWWGVDYSGWPRAKFLQFTDNALVDGRSTTATLFNGTRAELMKVLEQ